MAVLKAIVSLYRPGEEKPIERYKTGVKVVEENKLFSSFQKNIIEFLGLNKQAQKFGSETFDLKFYRLTRISGKAENYAISTQQQLELELPFLLGSDGESELNGKKSVIWIKMDYMRLFNCSDLLYLEAATSRYMAGHTFAIASQEPTGLRSFVIFVSNSVKSLVL